MKKHRLMRVAATMVGMLACVAAWAQDTAPEQADAKLSAAERQRVAEITVQAQQEIRLAQAEIDVLRAQLNRLLLNANADLKEAEKLLRQALEWELKIRVAEIRREADIRKVIGDKRWAESLGAASRAARRVGEAVTQKMEQKIDALAERIVDLRLTRSNRDEVRNRLKSMLRELLQEDPPTSAAAP